MRAPASWRRLYQRWLGRRLPPAREVTLDQRRIFIFPTGYGFFFLLLALALFIGGINYQNNLVIGFSFLLFSVFCVAILHTFRNLSGVTLRVVGSRSAFVGEPGSLQVHLLAQGRRSHRALLMRWTEEDEQGLSLEPGEEGTLWLTFPLRRRGWNRPGRLRIYSQYPLGLLRAWSLPDLDIACLAWPKPMPGGECPAQGGDDEQGRQQLRDGNEDFAGLRDYLPGDALHRIDWKAYARGRGLNVRYFSDPAEGRRWLDWALLPGMDAEQRLSRLCFWALALEQAGLPWGMKLPGLELPVDTGAAHLRQVLDQLALYGG